VEGQTPTIPHKLEVRKCIKKSDFSLYTCFSLLQLLSAVYYTPLHRRVAIQYPSRGVLCVSSFTAFLIISVYFKSKRTFPPASSSPLLLKSPLQAQSYPPNRNRSKPRRKSPSKGSSPASCSTSSSLGFEYTIYTKDWEMPK